MCYTFVFTFLKSSLRSRDEAPKPIHVAHWAESRGTVANTGPPNCTMRPCNISSPPRTHLKRFALPKLLKIEFESLIWRALTWLNNCIMTKVLNTIVWWRDGPIPTSCRGMPKRSGPGPSSHAMMASWKAAWPKICLGRGPLKSTKL